MKRLISVLIVVIVIGFIASCKPKEKCPAYGKYQSSHPVNPYS